jgi:hypothetical protein
MSLFELMKSATPGIKFLLFFGRIINHAWQNRKYFSLFLWWLPDLQDFLLVWLCIKVECTFYIIFIISGLVGILAELEVALTQLYFISSAVLKYSSVQILGLLWHEQCHMPFVSFILFLLLSLQDASYLSHLLFNYFKD